MRWNLLIYKYRRFIQQSHFRLSILEDIFWDKLECFLSQIFFPHKYFSHPFWHILWIFSVNGDWILEPSWKGMEWKRSKERITSCVSLTSGSSVLNISQNATTHSCTHSHIWMQHIISMWPTSIPLSLKEVLSIHPSSILFPASSSSIFGTVTNERGGWVNDRNIQKKGRVEKPFWTKDNMIRSEKEGKKRRKRVTLDVVSSWATLKECEGNKKKDGKEEEEDHPYGTLRG